MLLAYDFQSGTYVDVFDKERYTEEYWTEKALLMAENGLIEEKFAIKNCHLTESGTLGG